MMHAIEPWVLSYLLNSLWQVPLLFAAGWLAARLVRPLGAPVEHRVWVAVLIAQSALPALSTCDLTWLRTLVPWGLSAKAGAGEVTLSMGPGVASGSLPVQGTLFAVIAAVYVSLCVYFALRFAWNLFRVRRLRAETTDANLTNEQEAYWQCYAESMGWHKVALAESARIRSPLTIGFRNKLLLFPQGMAGRLTSTEFEAVVAHECAHILRDDFARNLCYELLTLPVRYHPALHLSRHNLAATREMVCDEMAAGNDNRTTYAKSLLRVASLLVGSRTMQTPHAIGIFDTNTLERRVMNLTGKMSNVRGMRRALSLAVCAVFGFGIALGAVAMRTNVSTVAAAGDEHPKETVKRIQVRGDIMAGNLIHKVTPTYPVEAKQRHIQGKVKLDAIINKQGEVENLKAVSGPKELQPSALDAVRQWKYKPFLLNGDPIEVETTINVNYTLSK